MSNYMDVLTNRTILAMWTATLIAILSAYALSLGFDGVLLTGASAAIAGLGVYSYMGKKVEETNNSE